jgi:hypothetical protein
MARSRMYFARSGVVISGYCAVSGFPEDEDFDVGQDTRTPVALIEYHYDCPLKFTGKINKLTFNLGPTFGEPTSEEAADR